MSQPAIWQSEVTMGNEHTSKKVATIASKAMRTPEKVTTKEIKSLGATALNQAQDKKKPAAKKKK